jgi:hypothetical protein
MTQLVTLTQIDDKLYEYFKNTFDESFNYLALNAPYNVPYVYYQTLSVTNYLTSLTTKVIDVYYKNEKIMNVLISKDNFISTVTIFNPTFLILITSLTYALIKSVSKYGIENVKLFVKNKSLALVINIQDNSKIVVNKVTEYLEQVKKEIDNFFINTAIIGFIFFIGYTYIKKNL